jgi:halimadienyl-diphosphate synthase
MNNFVELLSQMGPGRVSNTAYDTAWVARLGDVDSEISNHALAWICENQNPDGSWGAYEPYYYHDRVISTLAAMIALTYRGRRSEDHRQIERGLVALERIAHGATGRLMADPNGATAGFEMIVPTLVVEAERIGILKQQTNTILARLAKQRLAKIEILKNRKINRTMTAAFSSEMAGADGQAMLDMDNLQEADGSISHSPSATAYYLAKIRPDDQKALSYLKQTVSRDGGVPMAMPFEVCERAWVLWNVSLVENLDQQTKKLCKPHLDALHQAWKPRQGVGFTRGHSVMDGDDTSLTYDVLTRFGYATDQDTLLEYEENDHFRCYPLEITYSISTNIHFVGALRQAGYEADHPLVMKATEFLLRNRTSDQFWYDKWHASPYYATGHAIIAFSNYRNDVIENSVKWIVDSQNNDGSWGYYAFPSAEETAYALQALSVWKKNGGELNKNILKNGLIWLKDHSTSPYPLMWLAKSLNYSEWIIQSELLSAKWLAEEAISS